MSSVIAGGAAISGCGARPMRRDKAHRQQARLKHFLLECYWRAGEPLQCHWCRRDLSNPRHRTLDHVTPRANGGAHGMSNVVFACDDCNQGRNRHAIRENARASAFWQPSPIYRMASWSLSAWWHEHHNDLVSGSARRWMKKGNIK